MTSKGGAMHSSSRTNVPRQARQRGQNREAKRTRVSTVKFYYVFGKKILQKISKIVIFL